ncbi:MULTISPECIES: hypothetical protein [Bifidobacterium]|nr:MULTISPECIES: hypothetical protein [Bifidobacterium]
MSRNRPESTRKDKTMIIAAITAFSLSLLGIAMRARLRRDGQL